MKINKNLHVNVSCIMQLEKYLDTYTETKICTPIPGHEKNVLLTVSLSKICCYIREACIYENRIKIFIATMLY